MKYLAVLPILIGLSLNTCVYAQVAGMVDLKVSDPDQKPLDGVLVQLIRVKDSSMSQYAVTGADGSAEFTGAKNDKYMIYITQTGYENYYSSGFVIDSANNKVVLPTINLKPQLMKEVVVEGKTPVIQHYADKTVVNVEKSMLSSLGSIYDVLKRSPGIMIDNNDNIKMRGKQNVLVMIDGRITSMTSADLANMLKGMPSESVEKIEFITNPSSKYDANGTAGIIKIILRKNTAIGTNVAMNAGYTQGIYPKSNDGINISSRTKKLNIFGLYNYSYRGSSNQFELDSKYYNGTEFQSATQQFEYLKFPITNNMARMGADFYASDKTTVGFIADGSIRQFRTAASTLTNEFDSTDIERSYNLTNSSSINTTYSYSGNLNLKHTFDSVGRELLVNIDYADYNNKGYQNVLTNYYNLNNSIASNPTIQYGYLPGDLNIYSFKADYDGQLGKKGKLETGIKTSYVKTDNNVMVYDGNDNTSPVDTTQSNHFIYTENINAAYATYSRTIPKADLQFGLRAEQTVSKGEQITTGQEFSHNFIQVFPTLSINDSVGTNHLLGLSATRRIDRPTYDQLNPFRLFVNPTFYKQGNPYLIPQNAYSVQLSDTYKEKYTLTLAYTHTANAITTVIFPFPGAKGIAEQTELNLNVFDNYNANFTMVNQFGKWLNTIVSADAFLSQYQANFASTNLNTSRFLWDVFANNTITLSKKLSFEVDGFYGSAYDLGYLYFKGSWNVNAGIKMSVLKGKGSITINANDIFWTDLTIATTSFAEFNQYVFVRRDTQFVGISFTYHIGNSQTSRSLHNKGGAEDEKKRADKTA